MSLGGGKMDGGGDSDPRRIMRVRDRWSLVVLRIPKTVGERHGGEGTAGASRRSAWVYLTQAADLYSSLKSRRAADEDAGFIL